ncbi:C39 family peptidase [Carboxydocella sp. JDF658]|uniref:C39 family peptidase n=1 Tax=Carboxydocella sp. JDF658 TaxID=1926600 RepID=UPI0009ACFA21|nr:C39 family peptidase [Carboxydocella sp. JDF658]GAW31962.1 hypothetical protein JDF658_17270 [Carboxydocella sp. JDF658]
MKKIFILCLLAILTFGFSMPVLAESQIVDETMINNQADSLTPAQIEQLNKEEAKKYQQVLKYIEQQAKNLKAQTSITPQWTYPVSKILNVPYHKQLYSTWCGPASALQIIDYNGKYSSVSGSTEYQKQQTLADQIGTNDNGSNTVNIRNVLNNYLSSIHSWTVKRIDSSSGAYDILWNIIDSNIFNAKQPVLVLVQTKYLPYYNGHASQHYVVVDALTKYIDDGTGQPVKSISTVRIVDPNPNSSYTGYHTVTFNDLYNAAKGYFDSGKQYYNVSY